MYLDMPRDEWGGTEFKLYIDNVFHQWIKYHNLKYYLLNIYLRIMMMIKIQ